MPPVTRRAFLTGLLAASSAPALLSGCIGDDDGAYGPWQGPVYDRDIRLRLVGWASLAPSSCNLQPWKVMLEGDDTLHLLVDADRLHPVTDPAFRQTTISQGTFLELLSMAAAAEGYKATITLFPDGPYQTAREMATHPVATVVLERDAAVLPPGLFASVRNRRTSLQPFSPRALASAERTALLTEARSVSGVGVGYLDRGPAFERLRALALEGLRLETATGSVAQELARFIRLTPDEVARHRDGRVPLSYAMGVPIRLLYGSYAFTDPESYLLRTTMARVAGQPETASAFAWMVTAENGREDQVRVGRAYMRLDLQAAALGVGIQPLSGTLADFAEAQAARHDVQTLLAGPGQEVQMLFRLGRLDKVDRMTPRRAAADLIVSPRR